MTDTLDYDPGSICESCPHPLDDHDVNFGVDLAGDHGLAVVLTCEVCECRRIWGPGRRLEDASFNPEAQEALGIPAREQGEQA